MRKRVLLLPVLALVLILRRHTDSTGYYPPTY